MSQPLRCNNGQMFKGTVVRAYDRQFIESDEARKPRAWVYKRGEVE